MSQPTARHRSNILPFTTRNRYPVSCPTHGPHSYGYIVCLCIAQFSSRVHSVIPPSNAHLGEIICGREGKGGEKHRPEECVLMCEGCVREKGLDRKGGRVE